MAAVSSGSRASAGRGAAAGGGRAGQGRHLHPGQQAAGQRDDLGPDLVLLISVQGEIAQAGVLGAKDASSDRARRRG